MFKMYFTQIFKIISYIQYIFNMLNIYLIHEILNI